MKDHINLTTFWFDDLINSYRAENSLRLNLQQETRNISIKSSRPFV